jgi:hypothetical protein
MHRATLTILLAQGAFYIATGLWSVVSRSTFERVTGPKSDYWLVRMVGLLAMVIGAALLAAALRGNIDAATWILALGSAAAFAAIDVVYATAGRISRIYLLDALVEVALLVALTIGWMAWLPGR